MSEKIYLKDKVSILKKIFTQLVQKNVLIKEPLLIYDSSNHEITRFIFDLKKILDKNFPITKLNSVYYMNKEKEQIDEIVKFQKKSIGIRISESLQFYEGELTDLNTIAELPSNVPKDLYVIIELKTSEGKLKLKLSGNIRKEFIKKKIKIGNIIRIFPENCSIQNLGESVNIVNSDAINNFGYFTVPNGKVLKKKIIIKEFTFYDFEIENFGKGVALKFLNHDSTRKLNDGIDCLLNKFGQIGKIDIFRGILIIENLNFLSNNSLYFLFKHPAHLNFPLTILLSDKIDQIDSRVFSLNSFNLDKLRAYCIKIEKNLTIIEIVKTFCKGFLKKKKFHSGSAIKKIKIILQKSNLEYCNSLIFLSSAAIRNENLLWACQNTIDFFELIHLNTEQFLQFHFSKNNFLKVYRSF